MSAATSQAISARLDAAFAHHATEEFPVINDNGKTVRVVLGSLYGERSPVATTSETIFVDAVLKAKPQGAKGTFVKKVSISSTMGPGLKLDLASITNAA